MGQLLSGGESRPVTVEDLRSVQRMRESLTRVEIPNPATPRQSARLPLLRMTRSTSSHETGGDPMSGRALYAFSAIAGLALVACANPGNTTTSTFQETTTMAPTTPPVVTTGELAPLGDPAIRARMNIRPVEWPLRFKSHQFGARCYDTLECDVRYYDQRINHGDPKPTRSSASYGPDYLKGWNGGYGGIRNFPPPAQAKWRSKDGTAHEAEIDIGALFKDELIRHNVPREEVSDQSEGKWEDEPSILLEVNDRTIRVYMSAYIPTKHYQRPGNKYSNYRDDLILVKTYTY